MDRNPPYDHDEKDDQPHGQPQDPEPSQPENDPPPSTDPGEVETPGRGGG